MSAVLKGRAVKWSVGTIACTAGIVSASSAHFTQSVTTNRTSEKANIKDTGGVVQAQVFHGFMKTLSLTVVPCALSGTNTIANAVSSSDAWMPAPGTLITITDDSGTIIDDNYNVISAREGRTVDGVATVDLELEAGDEGVELATAPLT